MKHKSNSWLLFKKHVLNLNMQFGCQKIVSKILAEVVLG